MTVSNCFATVSVLYFRLHIVVSSERCFCCLGSTQLHARFERARGMRMAQKIYVGNMNYATTEDSLKNAFSQYGEVVSAVVIRDRYTEQSKGFGFVEMADDGAAEAAIAGLNGTEFEGRRIRVNQAEDRPRNPRPRPSYNRSEESASASY